MLQMKVWPQNYKKGVQRLKNYNFRQKNKQQVFRLKSLVKSKLTALEE